MSKATILYHAEQMVEVLVSIRIRRGEEEQFLTWSTSVFDLISAPGSRYGIS